jgi:hypothetical protein
MKYKVCTECKENKPITAFTITKDSGGSKIESKCNDCKKKK